MENVAFTNYSDAVASRCACAKALLERYPRVWNALAKRYLDSCDGVDFCSAHCSDDHITAMGAAKADVIKVIAGADSDLYLEQFYGCNLTLPQAIVSAVVELDSDIAQYGDFHGHGGWRCHENVWIRRLYIAADRDPIYSDRFECVWRNATSGYDHYVQTRGFKARRLLSAVKNRARDVFCAFKSFFA